MFYSKNRTSFVVLFSSLHLLFISGDILKLGVHLISSTIKFNVQVKAYNRQTRGLMGDSSTQSLSVSSQMSSTPAATLESQVESTTGTPESQIALQIRTEDVAPIADVDIKKSRSFSGVWVKDFTRLDPKTAQCNHYKNKFSAPAKNETSSLRSYAERCSKNPDRKKE